MNSTNKGRVSNLQKFCVLARDMAAYPKLLDTVAQQMSQGGGVRDPEVQATWLRLIAKWYLAGANVFNLTDSLVAALLLTEIKGNAWPADVKLPFDTFLVELPPGYVQLGKDWLRYIVVGRMKYTDGAVSILAYGTHDLGIDAQSNSVKEGSIDLVANIPLSQEVADSLVDGEPPGMKLVGVFRRLAIGVCAWLQIQGPKAEVTQNILRAQSRQQRGPVERPDVIVVGQGVKLGRELRDAAKDFVAAAHGRPRTGWKLAFRHVVRGHWRNQPYGPGRAERRRQWIEPFWKGPASGVGMSHLYEPAKRP